MTTTPAALSELKPCPFCEAVPLVSGQSAIIEHAPSCYLRRFIGSGKLWMSADAQQWNLRSRPNEGMREVLKELVAATQCECELYSKPPCAHCVGVAVLALPAAVAPGEECRHCYGSRFRMTHPAGVREPCFACNHDAWPT